MSENEWMIQISLQSGVVVMEVIVALFFYAVI